MSQWLESSLAALTASSIAGFVRDDVWAYPALETLHIVGIGLVFGPIIAFDLRAVGWHRKLSLNQLAGHLLPLVWIGFALNLTSGALLFASDAVEFAANPAFQVKLLLIGLAGLNAALYHSRVAHTYQNPGLSSGTLPLTARLSAMVSIILWLAIITAGRLMAYIK